MAEIQGKDGRPRERVDREKGQAKGVDGAAVLKALRAEIASLQKEIVRRMFRFRPRGRAGARHHRRAADVLPDAAHLASTSSAAISSTSRDGGFELTEMLLAALNFRGAAAGDAARRSHHRRSVGPVTLRLAVRTSTRSRRSSARPAPGYSPGAVGCAQRRSTARAETTSQLQFKIGLARLCDGDPDGA